MHHSTARTYGTESKISEFVCPVSVRYFRFWNERMRLVGCVRSFPGWLKNRASEGVSWSLRRNKASMRDQPLRANRATVPDWNLHCHLVGVPGGTKPTSTGPRETNGHRARQSERGVALSWLRRPVLCKILVSTSTLIQLEEFRTRVPVFTSYPLWPVSVPRDQERPGGTSGHIPWPFSAGLCGSPSWRTLPPSLS